MTKTILTTTLLLVLSGCSVLSELVGCANKGQEAIHYVECEKWGAEPDLIDGLIRDNGSATATWQGNVWIDDGFDSEPSEFVLDFRTRNISTAIEDKDFTLEGEFNQYGNIDADATYGNKTSRAVGTIYRNTERPNELGGEFIGDFRGGFKATSN